LSGWAQTAKKKIALGPFNQMSGKEEEYSVKAAFDKKNVLITGYNVTRGSALTIF